MDDHRSQQDTEAGVPPSSEPEAQAQPASGATEPSPTQPRVVDKRRVADTAPDTPAGDANAGSGEDAESALGKAQAEAAQYLDDLRRLKAEFENFKKRMIRDQSAVVETATIALIEQLLPVTDDFRLAMIAADRTKDYDSLVRGVELVFSKLREVLDKQGLKEIDALGMPFDPELHEAVMQDEGGSEDGKPVVSEVFRPGYTLHGRVVRAAMVKVRKQ